MRSGTTLTNQPADTISPYLAEGQLGLSRYMAIMGVRCIRAEYPQLSDVPLRTLFATPSFQAQWKAAIEKETEALRRRAAAFPNTNPMDALALSKRVPATMEAEAERILALDECGGFDHINLDPRSRWIVDAMAPFCGEDEAPDGAWLATIHKMAVVNKLFPASLERNPS